MSDWIILRCKGSSTLRLARSLPLAGFDAWTPIEVQVKRDRRTGQRTEAMTAVMPSYVFAKAADLIDLVALSESPGGFTGDFSVFRFDGRFPVIEDHELTRLRLIERRAAAKAQPVIFSKGTHLRVPDGPYQGLTGQVTDSNNKITTLDFGGFTIPVKFETWTLQQAA